MAAARAENVMPRTTDSIALVAALSAAACVVGPASPTATAPAPTKPRDAEPARTATATGPEATVRSESILEVVPFQRWHQVPGRVVGLLYASGAQPWGGSISHGRGFETGTARREYKFSFDASSPYALYFESPDGRGNNFLQNWAVSIPSADRRGQARYDAAMFDPATPNDWGLRAEAHLVELEVNSGRGGAGIHFVATDARVLDGADGFPADPVAILIDARRRFDAEVDARAAELDEIYGASRRDAEGQQAQGKRTTTDGQPEIVVWPTWLSDRHRLQITFAYRRAGQTKDVLVQKHPDCPPGAPCVDWGPEVQEFVRIFGVQMGATLVVDPSGRIDEVTVYRPEEWSYSQP